MSKYAIDFDGVVIGHPDIPTRKDWYADLPNEGAKEALWLLKENHDIYILTSRPEDEFPLIEEWLDKHNMPKLEITNTKKEGTSIYLDDRAVRFTNWKDFIKLVI